MNLTKREAATVLAALRYWQHDRQVRPAEIASQFDMIANDCERLKPLKTKEIDVLCEKINTTLKGD